MHKISVSLRDHLLSEAILVLGIFGQLSHDRPRRGRDEETSVLASSHGLHGGLFLLELDDSGALGASAVVDEDETALDLAKDAERPVEQFVGDEGAQVGHLHGSLVGRDTDLHGAAVVQLAVHILLHLLSVQLGAHFDKGEMLLRVEKDLADFAALRGQLLQILFSGLGRQIADVEAGTARELLLGDVDGRQLVGGSLNLAESIEDKVSPGAVSVVASGSAAGATGASAVRAAAWASAIAAALMPAAASAATYIS